MRLLERILLPTDFSEASQEATETAAYLARSYGARIHLLHVIQDGDGFPLDLDAARVAVGEKLEALRGQLADEGLAVPEPEIEIGNPPDRITQYADRQDINLIVVGSRGTSEGDHVLGFTAEKAIRRSGIPVWVTRVGENPPVRRIVCAVDFSDPSRYALDSAVHLARDLGAELTILHVIQPLSGFGIGAGRLGASSVSDYEVRQREDFDQFLTNFDLGDVPWKRQIRGGQSHEEIVAVARQEEADLLVVGSVGRSGPARMLVGSTAERVLRHMPCSMVIAKSRDAIRLQIEEEIADVELRFNEGRELLRANLALEAISHFEYCLSKDMMFAPAYEGLAEAHERLGHRRRADEAREQAAYVHRKNWERKVEAEVRTELWGRKASETVAVHTRAGT